MPHIVVLIPKLAHNALCLSSQQRFTGPRQSNLYSCINRFEGGLLNTCIKGTWISMACESVSGIDDRLSEDGMGWPVLILRARKNPSIGSESAAKYIN